MTEAELQKEVRLTVGQLPGVVCWRNNVGLATYKNSKVPYGLCPGSSDLILIVQCFPVLEERGRFDVKPLGRFAAFEIKTQRGRVREEQVRFIQLVRKLGGFADVVRSVEQALEAIAIIRRGGYHLPDTKIETERS